MLFLEFKLRLKIDCLRNATYCWFNHNHNVNIRCEVWSAERGARSNKNLNWCRRLTKGRAVWGSVCGPWPWRRHISTLSLNFKGEECDVCTSVYQPLVPSIFWLGLMSAPQYDNKALDTVYFFIHQVCTLFTHSTFHVSSFYNPL